MAKGKRLERARLSLEGLSVGDGFGEKFFGHTHVVQALIRSRALPKEPWHYTDDTNMALSIYETLREFGEIDQDALAQSYAEHYHPLRGYGAAMHGLLAKIGAGESWKTAAGALFEGQGSYGNGAAMRAAPLGAYFADDLSRVIEQAAKSAEITHQHPEGIAGAIAVAVAAAVACDLAGGNVPSRTEFIGLILPNVPDSEVKSGIRRAREIRSSEVEHVIGMIGNGYRITAQDTVPFTLWCAGEKLDEYESALWLTAAGLGDVDTNCAIVGGIVAGFVGWDGLPRDWIERREPLPEWAVG